MSRIHNSIRALGTAAAVFGFVAATLPAQAQRASESPRQIVNPCAPKAANPCAAKSANPCAAQKPSSSSPKTNPCAAKAARDQQQSWAEFNARQDDQSE